MAKALSEGEHLLQGMLGRQISGWRIVFAERRGRNFKVIFQHDTSKEVKEVMEADVVWKEKGIPFLLARAHARPASDLGHLCEKHGEFYFGDFCMKCDEEAVKPDIPTCKSCGNVLHRDAKGEDFCPTCESGVGPYDSTNDTLDHIHRVKALMERVGLDVLGRGVSHDATKLLPPEKPIFDEFTPKLKGCTYGSDEYKGYLKEMSKALEHHYRMNRHHPEHFRLWKCSVCDGVFRDAETRPSDCYEGNPRFCPKCCPVGTIMECILEPRANVEGMGGMNLIDLLEMLADWKAASERPADGDIKRSLEINEKRFNIPKPLMQILWNTVRDLGWYEGE